VAFSADDKAARHAREAIENKHMEDLGMYLAGSGWMPTSKGTKGGKDKGSGKSKGKGKSDDRLCYNCGKGGHLAKGCPNPSKGNGKGKSTSYGGKSNWSQPWSSTGAIKSLCSLTTVVEKKHQRQRWKNHQKY
jgi:hypothetical protein